MLELRRLGSRADALDLPKSAAGTLLTFRSPCTTCWRAASSRNTSPCASSSASRPWSTTHSPAACLPASIARKLSVPGTRFDNNKLYQDRYWHEQYFNAVERLRQIAQSAGRSLVSLSLNWLLHHTAADVIILGASSLEQLNENLAAGEEGPLPEDVVKACDQVWHDLRGPLPVYNR